MIIIDNIYISDEVIEEQFVCDLKKCKGGCCVEGDAGAPLTKEEMKEVINNTALEAKDEATEIADQLLASK